MVVSSGAAILNTFKINLVLTDLIKSQVFESLIMLGCGMVVALLYGLFKRRIKAGLKNNIVAAATEIIFWIFAAILTCQFLYYCSYGQLSTHVICSFICGVFLWNLLFYATMCVGDDKCLNKRKKGAKSLKAPIK
ncbi:MAG: spore cortex biosynthesis protein YabQ [Aminipila sp.]